MTSISELVEPEPQPFTGTPWFDLQFLSYDCETTAADPEEARIVAAAALVIGGRRPTTARAWFLDPGVEIPADATKVHDIATEHAQEAGELPGDAIPEIVERLADRPDGCPLVCFNARYDLTVLDRECRRYGITPLQDRGELLVIDPFVIDKHLDRYRPGSRTQAAICQHYRIQLDADTHDAVYDARLAAFLARRLCREAKVIRRDDYETWPLQSEWDRVRCDPRALHQAQAGWAAFQARGLRAHFIKQGKHDLAAEVSEDWPIQRLKGSIR